MSNVYKALYFYFESSNFSDHSNKAVVYSRSSFGCVLKSLLLTFVCATSVFSLTAQTRPVQILNFSSALPSADIYVNGVKVAENLLSNTATPFLLVAAEGSAQVVVATAESSSIADSLFTLSVNIGADEGYAFAIYDSPDTGETGLMAFSGVSAESSDTSHIEVSFVHLAPSVAAVHVLVRDGGMIVNNLGFSQNTAPITFNSTDYYLDVKSALTLNIISTYRFSPQGSEGEIVYIYMVGDASTASAYRMYAVHADGFVYQIDFAPIATVQYINAASDTVDVYKNGTRFADNTAPGAAMPFKFVPAELNMNIAVAGPSSSNPQNAYGTFPFTFSNAGTYQAISTGRIDGTTYPLEVFFSGQARTRALDTTGVDIVFFNGAYLEPSSLSLRMDDAPFSNSADYGGFTPYVTTNSSTHDFELVRATGESLGSFSINLETLAGRAITIFTRNATIGGMLEIWMALSNGNSSRVWTETVGIDDAANWLELATVFPNPMTDNTIYVRCPDENEAPSLHFSLLDITGRLIASGQLEQTFFPALWQIRTPPIPSGAYQLHVQDVKGQSKTFQIIK